MPRMYVPLLTVTREVVVVLSDPHPLQPPPYHAPCVLFWYFNPPWSGGELLYYIVIVTVYLFFKGKCFLKHQICY